MSSQGKWNNILSRFAFVDVVQPEVRRLSRLKMWQANLPLLFDWSLIAAAISISVASESTLVYLCSVLVIAARQHALLIMVHEGAHFRLAANRGVNEFISNVFAAFPNFFCTAGYRANHHAHHQHLNSESDPDWARKVHLSEWQFPQNQKELAITLAKVMATSWYKLILLFWTLSGIGRRDTWTKPAPRALLLQKLAFYTIAAGVISAFSLWPGVVKYWVVPYLFVMPVLERVRSISEHFGLGYGHALDESRNILSGPFEAFFFGPHNIRYHLAHHMFPMVPQYNLPALHAYLMGYPEYHDLAHVNDSYFTGKNSVFKDLSSPTTSNGEERCLRKNTMSA